MPPKTLAMSITGIILGSKRGFIAQGLYVILGAIGMPIFANFTGGLQILLGPTGGFILSFPIMTYIIGYICERKNSKSYYFLKGLFVYLSIKRLREIIQREDLNGKTMV